VNSYVRVGASPRGAQALVLGAKCVALTKGRVTVSTEDIRAIAPQALRHRVILNFEGEAEGLTTDQVVEQITSTAPEQMAVGA
jgi:MoxR-like ATPase